MGKYSHVILNVGNNMGKYSHDIHNIGIREQAALFSQKNPSYVILGVNSFTKISQLRNSMSQFFPNYWEFSHLIPNWEFRKVSCVSIKPLTIVKVVGDWRGSGLRLSLQCFGKAHCMG